MAALLWMTGFAAVVGLLAARNASRIGGRGCCAPADPRLDLRMRTVDDEEGRRVEHAPTSEM